MTSYKFICQQYRREKAPEVNSFPSLFLKGFSLTMEYDSMDTLRKSENVSDIPLVPEEEQRSLLRSSKGDSRCSSLVDINSIDSEEIEMDYLAKILIEIFLDLKRNEQ